jgi:hypothetical protein
MTENRARGQRQAQKSGTKNAASPKESGVLFDHDT